MYEITSEIDGEGVLFGDNLLDILAQSLDTKCNNADKIVKVVYKDRYMKNPLSVGLFVSFIRSLKERYSKNWNCPSISIETEIVKSTDQYNDQSYFYNDWLDADVRRNVIQCISERIGLGIKICEKNKNELEHDRCMYITLSNGEVIMLMLGQGFSYWRCEDYMYKDKGNKYHFYANENEQAEKILKELPRVHGEKYPTRICFTFKNRK